MIVLSSFSNSLTFIIVRYRFSGCRIVAIFGLVATNCETLSRNGDMKSSENAWNPTVPYLTRHPICCYITVGKHTTLLKTDGKECYPGDLFLLHTVQQETIYNERSGYQAETSLKVRDIQQTLLLLCFKLWFAFDFLNAVRKKVG